MCYFFTFISKLVNFSSAIIGLQYLCVSACACVRLCIRELKKYCVNQLETCDLVADLWDSYVGYYGVVVNVWDSYVSYCGVMVGVWDSYVGYCGVVVDL